VTARERITRRQALRDIGAAGLGLTAAGAGIDGLLAGAAAAAPRTGTLKDIEHVVILIQENRSFDHYFGTLSGVRGFGDKANREAFFQRGVNGETLHPFRLQTDCLPDLTHDWGPQHRSWNGGKMNRFLVQHEEVDVPSGDGSPNGTGAETMGYYTRADLPFYYALADAFTICDAYFCSVIGPTYPNRLMSMSATIDPDGAHGGPLVETLKASNYNSYLRRFTWTTMPERLQSQGVSWKVYNSSAGGILDNMLVFFKACRPGSPLYRLGTQPSFPADFLSDIAANRLPQVSWLLTGYLQTEHPDESSPPAGEAAVRQVVEALIAKPEVWRKTALFITWDENGGFFDHVPPPTPPKGTKGEYLTVARLPDESADIRGPIGLGFRVPMLVISPFSRRGLVCSEVFDHTSTLRFLETRFGVEVPNLSSWRRQIAGDLTSAFNFAAKPNYGRPALPDASAGSCTMFEPPSSTAGPFPKQEPGTRKRPSGLVR
jgi:phospholipase C